MSESELRGVVRAADLSEVPAGTADRSRANAQRMRRESWLFSLGILFFQVTDSWGWCSAFVLSTSV